MRWAFVSTSRVKLPPGRVMDRNNSRIARHSFLNECKRLLSPSILQTAEAGNPDSKHAGLFWILARLAPIDFVDARGYSKR